ncbi:MAG: hypothetical protein ACOCQS_01210 [Bacillota bacterium]
MITRKRIVLGIILFLFLFSIFDIQQGILPEVSKNIINIEVEEIEKLKNLEEFQNMEFQEYEYENNSSRIE